MYAVASSLLTDRGAERSRAACVCVWSWAGSPQAPRKTGCGVRRKLGSRLPTAASSGYSKDMVEDFSPRLCTVVIGVFCFLK